MGKQVSSSTSSSQDAIDYQEEGEVRGSLVGDMARFHLKVTPLMVYMTVLATYSALMMLACLHSDLDQDKNQEKAAPFLSTQGDPRQRRIQHGRSWLKDVDDFYSHIGTTQTTCSKMVSFGGSSCRGALDNNKYVCLDEDVALKPNQCTIYSFGIGDDTTFDDHMNFYGCDVFMFDPSVSKGPIVSTNYKREKFYLLGIDTFRYNLTHHLNYVSDGRKENVTGEYDTYESIRHRLGHENRPVHYLKLDIENTEWRVLPYLVQGGWLEGVKQLAIEVHTMDIIKAPQDKVLDMLYWYWEVLERLTRLGFLRAAYRPNLVLESLYHVPGENRTIPTCFEVLYLRRGPEY